jgi:Alanine dehydrogenase/PNT, C-terminal domain
VAAVATDAALTPYHALKTIAGLKAGETVVVIGLGRLGLNAVAIAKLLGASVYGADFKVIAPSSLLPHMHFLFLIHSLLTLYSFTHSLLFYALFTHSLHSLLTFYSLFTHSLV